VEISWEETSRYPADEEVAAAVTLAMAPVQELEKATIAQVPQSLLATLPNRVLSSKRSRFAESSMASFLASALRSCLQADAAFINGGAVRGDRDYKEDITYAHLKTECPFPSVNVVVKIPGHLAAAALRVSRQPWLDENGPQEASQALHGDFGTGCQLKDTGYELVRLDDQDLVHDRLYSIAYDSYDLKKNPVLKEWAINNPDAVPPEDAGRPTLPILVEHFCNEMWRTLIDMDGSGDINEDSIEAFFESADANGDGALTFDELMDALSLRLGSGTSAVVAQQMVSMALGMSMGTKDEISQQDVKQLLLQETDSQSPTRSPKNKTSTALLKKALLQRVKTTPLRLPGIQRSVSAPSPYAGPEDSEEDESPPLATRAFRKRVQTERPPKVSWMTDEED